MYKCIHYFLYVYVYLIMIVTLQGSAHFPQSRFESYFSHSENPDSEEHQYLFSISYCTHKMFSELLH